MNKQMALSVLVRLVDRLTGPLQRIMGRIQGLSGATDRVRRFTGRVGELSQRIGALGTIGTAISFVGPLKAAADMDKMVRDLAITMGTTSKDMEADVARLTKFFHALALAVGQPSIKLVEGAQILGAANIDRSSILTLMPQVGRAATASGAAIADMSRLAISLTKNMKAATEQMEQYLAGLAVAGKEGSVELPDMAKLFPALTGHMANLGTVGKPGAAALASMLQVAIFGAGSASQAGTNLENFLSKILSKETIKNFQKKGVDVVGTMEGAVWKGINPIEAVLKKILDLSGMTTEEIEELQARARKGGITDPAEIAAISARIRAIRGGGEVAALMSDMQVKNFLIPTLANIDFYKKTEAKVLDAMHADPSTGVLADDFRSRMAGLTAQLERFQEVGVQAARRVGRAFATNLGTVNAGLEKLLANVKAFDKLFPGWADSAIAWGGSLLLATVALGAFGQAVAFVGGGLAALGIAASGWVAALVVGTAAIGAAALVVLSEWKPVQDLFEGISKAIDRAFTIPRWVKQMFSGGSKASIEISPPSAAGGKSYAPLAAPEQKVGGRIVVSVEGPGKITRAESEHRNVPLVPDRGLMLGVP